MSDNMSEQWYTEVYLKQQEEAEGSTWNAVRKDIDERESMGAKKYGKYLTTNTDEDMLQHAYEEALDLTVYLKTLLEQRKKHG